MKEAMKRLILNETSQENVPLNVMHLKKSSETSPERASRLEKHGLESSESQNQHRQDIIKRKRLITANDTDDHRK
jgi:hypothetical protein